MRTGSGSSSNFYVQAARVGGCRCRLIWGGREVWWDPSSPLSEVSRCSRVAAPMRTGSGSSSNFYVKAARMGDCRCRRNSLQRERLHVSLSPRGEVKRVVLGVALRTATGSGLPFLYEKAARMGAAGVGKFIFLRGRAPCGGPSPTCGC